MDLLGGAPVKFTDWRNKATKSGVGGDPTLATPEKGRITLEAAVAGLVAVAREFRQIYWAERRTIGARRSSRRKS